MFETEQICPYTGLRSFTEDESLYFKGREDDIDQATEQLQRNKFLMLTGASGDGKSSLIYAGIIPNARAGFLKSKYSHWCVADFRPERTPFHNLCRAIARQLDIENPYTVQSELNHGFSAIADLYKSSNRYIDTSSIAWEKANESGKSEMKREAANLVILVDQFEEFFTNPENYNKGVPSRDAGLVLNLLLETARISLEEDLPIYIVFTMRSDYIGQCAAFRGLPEYIGFSQFFVPRLNRTQLQQVIEEPAVLSGNRITRRLTERLIHDLTEGVDQLPILQHALNQIWHAAKNGTEEMDLIHYAMVGGMPVTELPDEQTNRFNQWFEALPPEIKNCYHEPNLQNVLDTHTNKLYEQAAEYYKQHTQKNISEEDARAIIKTTFICLTKIDQSRAVRNRMTLKEITNIIGRPEFGTREVGAVLNIFREPGNTFIRPFILEDPQTKTLQENDVLDITHESLIRNWEFLERWAKEEFDNYTISLDYEQQLNRWVESGKSKGFLLSIGPLTYFENWFNKAKPNAHWIARYLPEDVQQDRKLERAQQVLGNSKDFLKRSAAKHVVTRTIIRYGPKRIVAVLALVAVILLSSFAVRDYFHRQNDYVLSDIRKKSFDIANRRKLSVEFPVPVITQQLIAGSVTVPQVIAAIDMPTQKIKIATAIATQLVNQGRYEPKKEIFQSLSIVDSLLEQLALDRNTTALTEGLQLIHDFSVTVDMACFFNNDQSLKAIQQHNANRSGRWAMFILKQQPPDFTDIQYLSLAIDNAINHKIFSEEEIATILGILSPFENAKGTEWRERNYQHDKILNRGAFDYGTPFNGLYQDLAYLYAASGKPGRALQCLDTLLHYQENYYQNDYSTYTENVFNIVPVFYVYGTTSYLDSFVHGYCDRKKLSPQLFYNKVVSISLIEPFLIRETHFYTGGGGQSFANRNLKLSDDGMLTFFFSKLKEEILKNKNINDRNFDMAVALKNEVTLYAYRKQSRGIDNTETDQLFKEAIHYYQQVPNEYLNRNISIVNSSASDLVTFPKKFIFLYPDYRVEFHPFEPRSIVVFVSSDAFIKYVLNNNLFDTLYKNNDELKYFEYWLADYQTTMCSGNLFLKNPVPATVLDHLATKLEERKAGQSADLNLLFLQLSNDAFENKSPDKAVRYLKQIQPDKLLNVFQYKIFDFVNNYSFELIAKAIATAAAANQFDLAYTFVNVFKKEVNRSSLYAYASQLVSSRLQLPAIANRLLDSAITEMKRLDNPSVFQPNRQGVAIALMYSDPEKYSAEAYKTIKNSSDKFAAVERFSRSYAYHGNLYAALQQLPPLTSTADKTIFYSKILEGYNSIQPVKPEWKLFLYNELLFRRMFLVYVDENE